MKKLHLCYIMKYFCIFSLILLAFRGKSQNDTLRLHQTYTSFSNQEKAEWTAFENNWNYFHYTNIKQKLKLKKLTWANCHSLFADLYLEINAKGNVTKAAYIKGKKCGVTCSDSSFATFFEKSILNFHFNTIRNKQFIDRFGNALKC